MVNLILAHAQSRLDEPAGSMADSSLNCGKLVLSCLVEAGVRLVEGSFVADTIMKSLSPTETPSPGDIVFVQYGKRALTSTHLDVPNYIMGILVEGTKVITAMGNKVRVWDWSRGVTKDAPVTYYTTPEEK